MKAKVFKRRVVAAFVAVGLGIGMMWGCGGGGDSEGDDTAATYTLTVAAAPTTGGLVTVNGFTGTGATTHNAGASVTVVASAASEYTFTGWSGADTSTNASLTITMDSNRTLTANFQQLTFTDSRDAKKYKTIIIGSQVWMAENINYETSSGSWCYDNSPDSCAKYGRLYTWDAAMSACPSGWHLSSDAEWSALTLAVGGDADAGTKLKSSTGWHGYEVDPGGTDDYGFSALPGGRRLPDGSYSGQGGPFDNVGSYGEWWTATHYDSDFGTSSVRRRSMSSGSRGVNQSGGTEKDYGLSARCLRD